jgi:methyltransferase (TIGR00027 family)
MATEAGKTGAGPTAAIAIDQYLPLEQRVVVDDLAYRMLPFGLRAFVQLMRLRLLRDLLIRWSERDIPGMWNGMLCCKRYIDDALADAAGQYEMVVNLGAGLDTRAYRLRVLQDVPVWEVDQPDTIRQKTARVGQILGAVPAGIHLVAMDFDRDDLSGVLAESGYRDVPTFFILEGVTQYLSEEGLAKTFEFLSGATRESLLAFTYVRKDLIDGRKLYDWEKARRKYVKGGLWLSGLEPAQVGEFLWTYGWRLVEDAGYDELADKYVRPTGRPHGSTKVERIALAKKL